VLVFDREQLRGVVNRAVAVVVVADRAIQKMVAENAIERLHRAAVARCDAVFTTKPSAAEAAQARRS
jgi:hypothetical protein